MNADGGGEQQIAAQAVERHQLIDASARRVNPAQARRVVHNRMRKPGRQQKIDVVERTREPFAVPPERDIDLSREIGMPRGSGPPRSLVEMEGRRLTSLAFQMQPVT